VLSSFAALAENTPYGDTDGTFDYTYGPKLKTSTDSSLTIKNTGKTEHDFELYQIFVGDVDTEGVLSNISWGNGVKASHSYGDATAKAKTLTDAAAAKAFADALMNDSNLQNPVEKANIAAGANAEWTGLNPGYYMVIDKANSQDANGQDAVYTAYIMQVVGVVSRQTKLDVPSVEKKVGDANDTVEKAKTDPTDPTITWVDTADYDFGDTIPYQITGTLPSNFAEYETYYYKFADTMTNQTYVADSAKVWVVNGATKTEAKVGFTITGSGNSLTVESADIKLLKANASDENYISVDKDTKIVVTYQATLNDTAAIGPTGNANEVTLTYSNNPNKGGDGDKGTTPPDNTLIFVYEIDVDKVQRDESAGLKTADEYNALDDSEKANWVLDTASGKYFKVKPLTGAGFTLYKEVADTEISGAKTGATILTELHASNSAILASGLAAAKYYVVAGTAAAGANSNFEFPGLDDGTYVLVETTVPAGFNAIDSQTVTVEATHTNDHEVLALGTLTADNANFTVEKDNQNKVTGHIDTDVLNEKGSTLPSTGGMGTTILYVGGSILVILAAILLITKRRMNAED